MRRIAPYGMILWLLLLSSCATAVRSIPTLQLEIFRAGELEIRVYQSRDAMVRDLPPGVQTWDNQVITPRQVIQIKGYFDRRTKTIYTIDDTRILIHELKHYLEPEWTHPLITE